MEKRLKFYKILHRITLLVGLAAIVLPIAFWKHIPEKIPQHYNGAGVADEWSDKTSLIVFFLLILILLGIMSIMEYYLKSVGLSPTATEGEKKILKTTYPMIVIMDFFMQIMFAYIVFSSATGRNLGVLFLPVSIIAIFLPFFIFIFGSIGNRKISKMQEKEYKACEQMEDGVVWRSKIDWWLGLILIGALLSTIIPSVKTILNGSPSWGLIAITVLTCLLILPLFDIKYILYSDHLTVFCSVYGKERIPYQAITSMKKTYNPISSAALSLKRIEVDYTLHGGNHTILISPIKRDTFIKEIEEKRKTVA